MYIYSYLLILQHHIILHTVFGRAELKKYYLRGPYSCFMYTDDRHNTTLYHVINVKKTKKLGVVIVTLEKMKTQT